MTCKKWCFWFKPSIKCLKLIVCHIFLYFYFCSFLSVEWEWGLLLSRDRVKNVHVCGRVRVSVCVGVFWRWKLVRIAKVPTYSRCWLVEKNFGLFPEKQPAQLFSLSLCVWCLCVCESWEKSQSDRHALVYTYETHKNTRKHTQTYTNTHKHTQTHMRVCVCVFRFVCLRVCGIGDCMLMYWQDWRIVCWRDWGIVCLCVWELRVCLQMHKHIRANIHKKQTHIPTIPQTHKHKNTQTHNAHGNTQIYKQKNPKAE